MKLSKAKRGIWVEYLGENVKIIDSNVGQNKVMIDYHNNKIIVDPESLIENEQLHTDSLWYY